MGLKFLLSLLSNLKYRNRGAENDQSFRAGLPSKLLPAASADAWLHCNTRRGLLPLPVATLQHSQALLPEDPVSVQNNCFAWQLTSRYLFEGVQGMLCLRAVLDPSQAAPGLCPRPKVLLPMVSLCFALPLHHTSAPQLLTWMLSVSNPCLQVLHLPGRPCPGILEEEHLHSS